MPENQQLPPSTPSAQPGTAQSELWIKYYEACWDARLAFVEERIADGETNPYRILKQIKTKERKYQISFSIPTMTSEFIPLTFAKDTEIGPAGTPLFYQSSVRGNQFPLPFYNIRTPIHEFILDYIDQTGPYDCIVELGCGDGNRIFDLYYCGGPRNIPYFGGELTATGRAMANRLAALDPEFPGHFVAYDHTRPDLSFLPKVERLLVFTVHSLEQVLRVGPGFFTAVATAAPRITCLNFEPFGFQVEDKGSVSRRQRNFFMRNRWNIDYAHELLSAQSKGILNIEFMATDIFPSLDPLNPTSLAIWSASAKAMSHE